MDIELKRKRIETLVKYAALPLIGFFVAPFILVVIKGLLGLIVAAVISLVAVNLAPAFAATVANWRLKALKAAAALNPIETLENQYAEKQAALLRMRDNIKQSYAVLQSLYAQIQEHNEKFPDKPSQYSDKYQKLKALVELQGRKYKAAQSNLAAYGDIIEEKRSDWKIAQTMKEASKLANVGEDFQSKLMNDTALTTVQDGLNLAFSELETSLLDAQSDESKPIVTVAPAKSAAAIPERTGPPTLDLGFDCATEAMPEKVSTSKRK